MPTGHEVTDSYVALRNALSSLSERTQDSMKKLTLKSQAMSVGLLAEQCDTRFGDSAVPGGDAAQQEASTAAQLAQASSGTTAASVEQVISQADRAIDSLQTILQAAPAPTFKLFADRFRGSLRVSPPTEPVLTEAMRAGPVMTTRSTSGSGAAPPSVVKAASDAQPGYVASAAMLFPTEAATLFPLGQSIAGNNGTMLFLIILAIGLFIIAIRYFATQEQGGSAPATKEIAVSLISFLLWVGALKGYWVTGGSGLVSTSLTPTAGAQLFGFLTIMWIAIVPYFVRNPTPPHQ